jgi:3-phenylpropionate/cinnamic acid dioxygenase small subunit
MNSVVHVESESSAVGSLDLLVLHARDGQWVVMGTARYSDTYVRTPEGWKIKTREIIPMVPQP